MARIPWDEINRNLTRDALDAASVSIERVGHPDHMTLSSVAVDCDRRIWLDHRWVNEEVAPQAKNVRLMETGRIDKDRIVGLLRKSGVHVALVDPDTGREWSTTALDGHLDVRVQGVCQGVVEAPKSVHVLKIASVAAKSFTKIVKGVEAGRPEHAIECQVAMHLLRIDRTLYVAMNRDTGELHVERLRRDPAAGKKLMERYARVLEAKTAPARISEDPKSHLCLGCKSKSVCHEAKRIERNCRNCTHSTPSKGGEWTCDKHRMIIDGKVMEEGCILHLYNPSVIPGAVVRVETVEGEDAITYLLNDGTTWTDSVMDQVDA